MMNPYENLPAEAFWRTAVSETNILSPGALYTKKWALDPAEKIAAAGSCFAQHVSKQLTRRKFNVLDVEPAPKRLKSWLRQTYGYSMYSARYGNLYTVKQLLQLAEEAFGERSPGHIAWQANGRYFDALRPAVEPDGLDSEEEVALHREYHLKQVRQLFMDMDVFIFTLGLTETWRDTESGTVFPTAPGVIASPTQPSSIEFHNFTHREVFEDFTKFMDLMAKHRGRSCKYLLTVSPVPLTATATGQHVLTASTYSKSVLRAVVGELYDLHDNIDYFPSYELVSSTWSRGIFFNQNLRTVAKAGVDTVMKVFFKQHTNQAATALDGSKTTPQADKPAPKHSAQDPQCEEAILDAFNSK